MYQPVGSASDTVVAEAEFAPEGALLYTRLLEEQREFEERLQEARESAFFEDGRRAMGVTVDNVDTSDLLLTRQQLEEVESRNSGTWKNIIEDCYTYGDWRDDEEPLDRVRAVSERSNVSERTAVEFDMENVSVAVEDGEEVIQIDVGAENLIELYVVPDNTELYKGMYGEAIVFEVGGVSGFVASFDRLLVRNFEERTREVMNSLASGSVQREVAATEIVLRNSIETKEYIPWEVLQEDTDGPSQLELDVGNLEAMEPLPNETTKEFLFETLERGYILSEQAVKLFELIDGGQRGLVSYSYLVEPRYMQEVARLLGKRMTAIPQMESILLSEEEPPEWMQELDERFPEKNSLSDDEVQEVIEYANLPEFLGFVQPWSKSLEAKEMLLELFEEQEVPQDKIVSYYLVPWECIKPSRESVLAAIGYGESLRERLQEVDEEFGTELYDSMVVWEQRKVYRRSDFDTE